MVEKNMTNLKKSVLAIGVANLISALLNVLYYPILTKIYGFSPQIFGEYQALLSLSAILSTVSLLSINFAYISDNHEHSQEEEQYFFASGVLISSIFSIAVFAVSLCFIPFQKVMLLTLMIESFSLFQISYSILRDKKDFRSAALLLTMQSILLVFLGTTMGYFLRNWLLLPLVYILSYIVVFLYAVFRYRLWFLPNMKTLTYLRLFLTGNKNIILFQSVTSLLNSSSLNVPILLINKIFGDYYTGLYSISFRLLSYTNSIITRGFSETFLPFMSKSEEDLKRIFQFFWKMAMLLGFIYIPVVLFPSVYIPILFEKSFLESAFIISILGVWHYTVAVSSPYTSVFIARKRTELGLILNLLLLILRSLAIIVGKYVGFWGSMWMMSIIGSTTFTIFALISNKLAEVRIRKNITTLLIFQIIILSISIFIS